ncbi:hypothetical protein DID76_00390 [Candidatus Marinamargulisbacteria bacterium SCGC AG-414-C22]|nr:hypothetical protein DID76_00390 [Candidatus Marinamargulisbacteria bacterium SCGC AG-414-C22]
MNKKIKILIISFILLPAIFFSFYLFQNKFNVGFDKKFLLETTFSVTGITCEACVAKIEKPLKKHKDILDVAVNYQNKTVLIKYNGKNLGYHQLKQKLKDLGYDIDHLSKNDIQLLNQVIIK